MQEFDSIRPYRDDEVPGVVARVLANPELGKAAARILMPGVLRERLFGELLANLLLRFKTRGVRSVADCQMLVAGYFEQLVESTFEAVSVTGLDALDTGGTYLFMSNHRDIVLDSGLLNLRIYRAGHATCRMAVGDNLLQNALAADLMRLNKSFIVERQVTGAKATLAALTRTSQYIRHSLQEGASVWIAQREGRAKDGWDRTDPALLKMLALAYKDHEVPLQQLLTQVRLVPVSISYELDPNALRKAHELKIRADQGGYEKSPVEDVDSMIMGILGAKGRAHLSFGVPLVAADVVGFEPEQVAMQLDRTIVGGMRVFPTHVAAAAALGDPVTQPAAVPPVPAIMAAYEAQVAACPEPERQHLLLQYANLLRNRSALALD